MKLWFWPKGAKDGVVLRAGPTIEWKDGHVWVDGKQLSEEEAAPYWEAMSPFTPEDTVGDGTTVKRRITKIDHENRIVTYE